MSTYQQSSHPGPLDPSQPNRRRPRRDPLAPQPDYFRRRLALIAVVGALIAPVALALRGDGNGVSSPSTPGAAALTQIDGTESTASPSLPADSAPPTVDPITVAPPPATEPPPSTVASRTCASTYVVLPGDSWYGIADRAGVAPGLIAGSNNVTVQEPLVPGDELCLPAGVSVAPPTSTADTDTSSQEESSGPRCGLDYVVQPGDSWYGIASRAGVKAGPLAAVNGKTLSSPLKVGQTICLPEGARRPPATTTTTRPPQTSGSQTGTQTSANDMRQVPYNPSRLYSPADVEQIVRAVWPDHLENDALYVVQRESRFNPGSRSRCCIGIFQINWGSHKRWLANYGVTDPAQLLDPEVNARMALVTWERSGSWRPWCTSSWCPPT
jgi:LysM repeat protein